VALALASLMPRTRTPILDLGCGCGHIAWSLLRRNINQPVIGLDTNFRVLYIAKRWMAPKAHYICCRADASLPFPDHLFSGVIAANSLHYLVDKAACVREVQRVTRDNALVAFTSIASRHSDVSHPPRVPRADQYEALLTTWPHRMITDADVLAQYLQQQSPDLVSSSEPERLVDERLFTIVLSKDPGVFERRERFAVWPHAEGPLGINPLYVQEGTDVPIQLRLQFPSPAYEQGSTASKTYLAETATVEPKLLEGLTG
jgi:SAM-dependent methyltransferase